MDKWIAVMVVGGLFAMAVPEGISAYQKGEVRIACFEAAKVNPNLKAKDCEL